MFSLKQSWKLTEINRLANELCFLKQYKNEYILPEHNRFSKITYTVRLSAQTKAI